MPEIVLLRITEGATVVLEAKLEVHDKKVALRNFYEQLPAVIQGLTPAIVNMVQMGCSEVEPPAELVGLLISGNHSGLQIVGAMPQNGNGPNRDQRRHPG